MNITETGEEKASDLEGNQRRACAGYSHHLEYVIFAARVNIT